VLVAANAALLVVCEADGDEGLAARIGQLCGRPARVVTLSDGPAPGARRNRSVAGDEPLLTFLTPADLAGGLVERVFLERATALLDEEPTLGWVTALGDGAAGWFGRVLPAGAALLCARPLVAHAPLVLRREAWQAAGGFDEQLACAEEAELLLRLVEAGVGGAVLADPAVRAAPFGAAWLDPLGDEARAASATVVARHQATFFAHLGDAVVGRERWIKELVRESRELARRLADAEAELAALDEEAAWLRR